MSRNSRKVTSAESGFSQIPSPLAGEGQGEGEILQYADALLAEIRTRAVDIAALEAEAQEKIARISAEYEEQLVPHRLLLASADKALTGLMKAEKKALFADGDVLSLPNGTLVRNQDWKVTIPRDALGKCEAMGFADVIKIAKNLDREAIEKWADERLFLIGAERKPATKFSYEVK
jgi:phage host-nuclease inhibitor protein Gam